MVSIKIILHSKIYSNGKSPVLLRIIKDRQVKYFKIGDNRYNFYRNQWSEEFGLLKRDKWNEDISLPVQKNVASSSCS